MSVPQLDDKDAFVRVARAIAPVRDHLVVIGGWAHRLHRYFDLARQLDFEPLTTEDIDLATSEAIEGSRFRLDDALEACGFRAEPSGDANPPATRYVFAESPSLYVQFVTHRRGSGDSRKAKSRGTARLAGVVAERLRHIDVLAMQPWSLELGGAVGFETGEAPPVVQIANASSFIAQKLLVASHRPPRDRAKDVAYVYDTLSLFAGALPALAAVWRDVAAEMHPTTARRVVELARILGSAVTDDIREAAVMLRTLDRSHHPAGEDIRRALDDGLRQVFPN